MYGDSERIIEAVNSGRHREVVGDAWEEIGSLQIEFLKEKGLQPQSRLLDIGCGSLRLGVHAVAFLDSGNYWGTDLHKTLLDAGYNAELRTHGLSERLPRNQLIVDSEFLFPGVPREFEYAIATSVFTHLAFNDLRLCLHRLEDHLVSSCTFYFSVFLAPDPHSLAFDVKHKPGDIITQSHTDPYHYLSDDIYYAAKHTSWRIDIIGDWKHPRGQQIVRAVLN
jgi:cyclopropane fatty-acyl-phospholipid synthase-like methyltransferase